MERVIGNFVYMFNIVASIGRDTITECVLFLTLPDLDIQI